MKQRALKAIEVRKAALQRAMNSNLNHELHRFIDRMESEIDGMELMYIVMFGEEPWKSESSEQESLPH